MNADVYVKKPSDIPNAEHYAVFKGSSIYVPGDERSRTNPGHGYPGGNEDVISYEIFLTKEKLDQYLAQADPHQARWWKIAHIQPLNLSITIGVR
jgi:hypothetical protein